MKKTSMEVVDRAIAMYDDGVMPCDIARDLGVSITSVRRWLDGQIPGMAKNGERKKLMAYEKPIRGGITRDQINDVRRHTYIGSWMIVKTCKGGKMDTTTNNVNGVQRMARVIDNSHRDFCIVELPTGIKEAIRWTDVMRCKRM